jgi:antigen flippase
VDILPRPFAWCLARTYPRQWRPRTIPGGTVCPVYYNEVSARNDGHSYRSQLMEQVTFGRRGPTIRHMPSDLPKIPRSGPSPQEVLQRAEEATSDEYTYGQILKSSALIGGSSVVSTGIALVRTKLLALLLGPAGFGLIGIYGSIADLARSIAEMGINNSGVRQIAAAVGSGETERIARTVTVLRRMSIILGSLGALLLFVFSKPLATLSFGDDRHAGAIALLSLAVFFRLVADGQGALIQGMRRITDLAKMGVLAALFGTIISIPVVYLLREDGVVVFLVGVAAMSIVTSWWYSRKVQIQVPAMTASQVRQEVAALLKLGFAFMANGFLTIGAAYAVRTIVLRNLGLAAAGLYQSAWSLGGLYCFYIYQGIFADFYPRLVGVANENRQCNRLVNEQTHITLLLAAPGVIATLTFAPEVIHLFYSSEFNAALEILRWICLGAALRVIYQPMGFIVVAKGKQGLFFGTELAWTIVNVSLSWLCVRSFGLSGAGIAFFGSYLFYGFMMYPIARRLSDFRWSAENWKTGLVFFSLTAIVFCGFYVLPPLLATGVGILATIASGVYSTRVLVKLVSPERIPRRIRQLLVRIRVLPEPVATPFQAPRVDSWPGKSGRPLASDTAVEALPPHVALAARRRRTSQLVSILIPAFNAERWIASSIKSAMGQTWPNKEIIIVDDGSSDATLDIARRFESNLVKVVAQTNKGASAARNKAFSFAQGDYIQWLDADDVLAPDKISEQMEFVEAGHRSLELFSAPFGVFHYRIEKARFTPTGIWRDLAPIDWIMKNFAEHAWMFPGAWLISRRLAELAGPWDERLSLNDDGEYICRVVLASEHVRFVRTTMCYYRNSSYTQLSRDTSERGLQSLLLSLKLCVQHLRSFEDSPRTRMVCVALLQLYLPYFYPDKTEPLDEVHKLTFELGGELSSPDRGWKIDLLSVLFGPKLAGSAIGSLRKMRLATAVKWDQFRSK